jgi:hypothetical protein
MNAVAEVNFEQRLEGHLRQNYADSVVKLPDGGEFTVATLAPDILDTLVRSAIARARRHELTFESSIATFVALMFHVSPNFDEHRLCEVLLADEEKQPDERMEEIPKVLSENNWDAIRESYDSTAWNELIDAEQEIWTERPDENADVAPIDKPGDPMDRTIANETRPGSTKRRGKTLHSRPQVKEAPEIDLDTIRNIDVKE